MPTAPASLSSLAVVSIDHPRKEEPGPAGVAMKTIGAFAVVLLATMLAAQQLVAVQGEIECYEVVQELMPCLGYLQGQEPSPPAGCCDGARALYAAADTREERQQTCVCLKAAYLQYNVRDSAAQALPKACHLGLSVPVTPGIDCSKIP